MYGDNFRDVTRATLRVLVPLQGSGYQSQHDAAIYGPTLTYLRDSPVLQDGNKRKWVKNGG